MAEPRTITIKVDLDIEGLDDTQRARVVALEAARQVLGSRGFGGHAPDAIDLHNIATFILDGGGPLGGDVWREARSSGHRAVAAGGGGS